MAYTAIQAYAPYAVTAFLKAIGFLEQTGIMVVDNNSKIIPTGDFLKIPKMNEISAFQRRDIDGTGTRTFNAMGTTQETGVILHDDIADTFPLGDAVRTGAEFEGYWASRVGLQWFRRVKLAAYIVAKAAIEAAQTSDGSTAKSDALVSDQYSSSAQQTMTFSVLQAAKAKRGDRAGDLTVAVMHSTCWNNLVQSGISSYVTDSIAGALVGLGGLSESDMQFMPGLNVVHLKALNMTIIVDDDISYSTLGTGSTYTYADRYETLLFGPGALYCGYQRALTLFADDNIAAEGGVTRRMRGEVDYCVHLNGIKWNSATTNPTDVQLGTKSNWDEAYDDYKKVKAVKLITNG